MSTLGGRLGFAARQRLAGREPLAATYYIDTCAADGISIMTGCKKSDGSLRIVAQEEHALWLRDADGRGLFAELSSSALQLAGEYRARDQELLKDEKCLSAEERQQRQRAKELLLEELLQKFWALPDEELMTFAAGLPANLADVRD
jgi:formylmethanofuran dehydrogenase subunit E